MVLLRGLAVGMKSCTRSKEEDAEQGRNSEDELEASSTEIKKKKAGKSFLGNVELLDRTDGPLKLVVINVKYYQIAWQMFFFQLQASG